MTFKVRRSMQLIDVARCCLSACQGAPGFPDISQCRHTLPGHFRLDASAQTRGVRRHDTRDRFALHRPPGTASHGRRGAGGREECLARENDQPAIRGGHPGARRLCHHGTNLFAAIVSNRGGSTCHATIIARELGIPVLVGCGEATTRLQIHRGNQRTTLWKATFLLVTQRLHGQQPRGLARRVEAEGNADGRGKAH